MIFNTYHIICFLCLPCLGLFLNCNDSSSLLILNKTFNNHLKPVIFDSNILLNFYTSSDFYKSSFNAKKIILILELKLLSTVKDFGNYFNFKIIFAKTN